MPNFLHCFKLGTSTVTNILEKSNYTLDEEVSSITSIDNCSSKIGAESLKSWITQELIISLDDAGSHDGEDKDFIHVDESIVTTAPGVTAKQKEEIPINFKLKREGLFGLPSTSSTLITNKYLVKT